MKKSNSFLDAILISNVEAISTTVCRKVICTDIYFNWKTLTLNSWKWRTLKKLVRRAYGVF